MLDNKYPILLVMKNLRKRKKIQYDIRKQFGSRLRLLRKEANLTQRTLAEAAGINPKYLSEIERGTKNATIDTVASIARALGVAPADLLPGGLVDELNFQISLWLKNNGSMSILEMFQKLINK